ncbi:MAG: hypothetical protein A2293_05650 [Elusimicrobia bacterium RIFOXYB2_FULL_49_7]|nr:MAG: hypothetical protein A2293_05650 [Elusimicrobia bacterium RIFOXYB2_FULL_49_7]
MVVVAVNRTMHSYTNTLKILCSAFRIDNDGLHVSCEKRIIEAAFACNSTFSATLLKLNPDDMDKFILVQIDKAGLGHNVFTEEATALIVRSADGYLRKCRNLCISRLIEAVRARTKSITIDIVNKVLIQPHWRFDYDLATDVAAQR